MGKWKNSYENGRKYNSTWELKFQWLTHKDDGCYCKVCNTVLRTIKKHNLVLHEKSSRHVKSTALIKNSKENNSRPSPKSKPVKQSSRPESSQCSSVNSTALIQNSKENSSSPKSKPVKPSSRPESSHISTDKREKWKKTYDQGRRYKKEWEREFKWLAYKNDISYCKVCNMSLKAMKKSNFLTHATSSKHVKNLASMPDLEFQYPDNELIVLEDFEMSTAITVGILTVSDRCSKGEAVDESGANLVALINEGQIFQGAVNKYGIIPDEVSLIKEKLLEWCEEEVNMIITTGGTGFAPRDVTPEAVREIIEKEAPALTTRMITESLKVTPLAMLSRPVCGIRGKTLIVTLPGSKKGSEECLRFIAPSVRHAVDLLLGCGKNVEKTHSELQGQGVSLQPHATSHRHCHHHHSYEEEESKADVSRICRRPRKSPYPMISVEEATDIIMVKAWQCGTKIVKMEDALGYVLAQDIQAKDALPPFPASIKDGYAVIADDGAGLRKVKGSSTAGCNPEECVVNSGECIRINTGAPVPPGADAVIQVEDTLLTKETDDGQTEVEIELLKTPRVGQDIRPTGCDIATGQTILTTGTLLGPSEVGLLATVGVTEVKVICKPTVAVLSTGNELQEPGQPLREGHIRDSNKTTLMSLLKQHNFPVIDAGIAKDDPTVLLKTLKGALSKADVLVTSGGVSMGERDILRPVLQSDFEAEVHFAQVFMKPGKPTTFATCVFNGQNKLILGLPGNPVSAVVTSNLYLLPLCRKMSGRANFMYTCIRAKLSEAIHLDPRPEYHRATLCWKTGETIPVAYSTGNQISSRLLSLASAQALLKLPNGTQELKSLPQDYIIDALILSL